MATGSPGARPSFGAAVTDTVTRADIALARAGAISAGLVALFTLAWLVTLPIAPQPDTDAGPAEMLAFIAAHDGWQIASYLVALPIALLMVPVWIALAAYTWSRKPALGLLSIAFGLLYAPFATWAYWSQITVTRGLAGLYATEPEQAVAAYRVAGFESELWSASYAADVAGYTLLGIAATLAGLALLDSARSLPRLTGGLYLLSALLILAWDTGFILEYDTLEGIGAIGSGVTFLGAVVASTVLLTRRGYRREAQSATFPPV